MPKRLRLRKEQRGRYEVLIDGTSVGYVRGNHGDWWALPVHSCQQHLPGGGIPARPEPLRALVGP